MYVQRWENVHQHSPRPYDVMTLIAYSVSCGICVEEARFNGGIVINVVVQKVCRHSPYTAMGVMEDDTHLQRTTLRIFTAYNAVVTSVRIMLLARNEKCIL